MTLLILGDIYEPLPEIAHPLFYIYLLISVFGGIMAGSLWIRNSKRKNPITKYLALNMTCYSLAVFALLIGLVDAINTGLKMEPYRISLGLSQFLIVLSNISMLFFFKEIYNMEFKKIKPAIILFVIISILVVLPNNYYGYPPEAKIGFGPSIRIYTNALMVFSSITMHIILGKQFYKTSKRVDEKYGRWGMLMIALSQFMMILVYISLIIDTLLFTFGANPLGYSIFIFLSWYIALAVLTFLYLGYLLPIYLRKHTESAQ